MRCCSIRYGLDHVCCYTGAGIRPLVLLCVSQVPGGAVELLHGELLLPRSLQHRLSKAPRSSWATVSRM